MTGHQKLSELYAELYGEVPDWIKEREMAIEKNKKLKQANKRLQCFSRDNKRVIVANKDGKRTYVNLCKKASATVHKPVVVMYRTM